MKFLVYLFSPLVFGVGFLAPLIAQLLTAVSFSINGIDNIYLGLFIGCLLGLIAQIRGSWVWVKP
jgi:hypothetical protein